VVCYDVSISMFAQREWRQGSIVLQIQNSTRVNNNTVKVEAHRIHKEVFFEVVTRVTVIIITLVLKLL
jgi:hypothetical protein